MKKKEIIEKCEIISSVFDDLENQRYNCRERDVGAMQSFAFDLLDHKGKRLTAILGKENEKMSEDLVPLMIELFDTGFALGYVVGRQFETPYPRIENAVRSIQALLKEKKLLPSVLNETVLSVKSFLDGEIKAKEWNLVQQSLKQLFENKERYNQIHNGQDGRATWDSPSYPKG